MIPLFNETVSGVAGTVIGGGGGVGIGVFALVGGFLLLLVMMAARLPFEFALAAVAPGVIVWAFQGFIPSSAAAIAIFLLAWVLATVVISLATAGR